MLTIDVIMLLNNVYSACAVHFYLRVFSTAVLFVYLLVLWVPSVVRHDTHFCISAGDTNTRRPAPYRIKAINKQM